jgi:hypothetical protein
MRFADPLRGFGQGLEIAQNSVLNEVRTTKGSLAALAVPLDSLDAIEDMTDIDAAVLHKGTAS